MTSPTPAPVPHKGATRHVLRNLEREVSMYTSAYESMPLDSLEAFKDAAVRWLGDKSELKETTIERADWPEVYAHYLAERATDTAAAKRAARPVVEPVEVEPAARPIPTFTPVVVRPRRPVVVEPVEVEPARPVVGPLADSIRERVQLAPADAAPADVEPVERDARWWDMSTPAERAAAEVEPAADARWWEVTKPSTYTGRGFVMVVEAADEWAAIIAACEAVGVAVVDSHGMRGVRVPAPVLPHATRTVPDASGDVHYAACVCSWVGEFPHYDAMSATREAASHVTAELREARIAANVAAINRSIEAERAAAEVEPAEVEPADVVADGIYVARLAIRARAIRAGLIPTAAEVAPAEVEPAAPVVVEPAEVEPATPAVWHVTSSAAARWAREIAAAEAAPAAPAVPAVPAGAACEAFLLCDNPAVVMLPHPILTHFPACQRCADRLDALSR